MTCRFGRHCMHPRWVTKRFHSYSGKEWNERVIDKHDAIDSGAFVKIRSPQATRVVGEPDSHGYRTVECDWLSKCCKPECTKQVVLTEKHRIRISWGAQR